MPAVKFVKTTAYTICIGDDVDPGRYMVDMIDVPAGSDIDEVLVNEVSHYLDYNEATIDRAVLNPNNDESEVAVLTITYDDNDRRGPFGGPWLVAKIAPSIRAVARPDADLRQMTLPLQIAS